MAEVTAKATFIGALILFLIGVVVATLLNYAEPALNSIAAGLDGPFDCVFDEKDQRTILCNETDFSLNQDCYYYYVKFYNKDTNNYTTHIKLSLSYRYERLETTKRHRIDYLDDDEEALLGKCSADYCGNFRFKDGGEYRDHPYMVRQINDAIENNSAVVPCFINPERPSEGAYLLLNDEVEKPEQRMFRYYEAWIILVVPVLVLVVIIVTLTTLFIRGDLAARPVQRKKELFVPPGFQTVSAHGSIHSSSKEAPVEPVPV